MPLKDVSNMILSVKENPSLLHNLLEYSTEAIVFSDLEGCVVYCNPAADKLYRYTTGELLGQNVDVFNAKETIETPEIVEAIKNTGRWSGILIQRRKDDSTFKSELNVSLVLNESNEPIGFGSHSRDVTEVIRTHNALTENEEQLKRALKEKELLLKEINHRTKNNMQIISSLLSLGARQTSDQLVKDMNRDINTKIKAMSLVHQKLYESKNLSTLKLHEYMNDLLHLLHESYNTDECDIVLHLDLQEVYVLIDSAMATGLVLSELMSNIYKHAFKNRNKGKIIVRLAKEKSDTIEVIISDNGIGFSSDLDITSLSSLGLTTVKGIVEKQMQGEINFISKNGLSCKFSFKDNFYKSRV